ncbi:MAG TPA: hypothetical protein PKH10_00470 [bacterium]|nr:hypothetical protein [bacterium]
MTNKKNLFGFPKKTKESEEIDQYLALIKKEPDNDRNYIRLAELYTRAGEEEKAIEVYEKVALLFEKKGFFNKAKAVLKQALAINPDHGRINVLLADLDKDDGLIKDAVMRYQTAVNYFINTGNKAAATTILKKIVEIQPQNISYAIKLATLLVTEKMYHDAEKILTPLMVSLKSTNKSADYVAVLKLLYLAKNENPDIGRELVKAYIKSGNHPQALSMLHKLLLADPESTDLLEQLAFLFERMGEKEKLEAVYKQLASVHQERHATEESHKYYRKVLELNPRDTEALLALNEEGRLRDIISGKIASASVDIAGDEHDEEEDEDIEIELDDHEKSAISTPTVAPSPPQENFVPEKNEPAPPSETLQRSASSRQTIKEAQVFRSYRLFDRALERLKAYPSWEKDVDILDLIAEIHIEKNDIRSGAETIFQLITVYLENGDEAHAKSIFYDAKDMLEIMPETFQQMQEVLASMEEQPMMLSTPEDAPTAPPSPKVDHHTEAPLLLDPEEEDAPSSPPAPSAADKEFADMARDLLTELNEIREPDQKRLDELEFFISIEDYQSATILLQELVSSYPESKLLVGFRDIIPLKKEENIADTLDEVKESLSKTMRGADQSAEDFYNMGIVHLSMGMIAEAIGYFEQAAQMNSADPKYLIAISDAWFQSGKNAQSLKYAQKALEKATDNDSKAEILEKIANLYYSAGDTSRQQQALEEVKRLKRR